MSNERDPLAPSIQKFLKTYFCKIVQKFWQFDLFLRLNIFRAKIHIFEGKRKDKFKRVRNRNEIGTQTVSRLQ